MNIGSLSHPNANSAYCLKPIGLSKLAVNLWSRELQRRLAEEGTEIIVMAVHPGMVLTGMFSPFGQWYFA